jgi:poly-gamma-glutamate synthesis protein (capsule biosynthesis protein)
VVESVNDVFIPSEQSNAVVANIPPPIYFTGDIMLGRFVETLGRRHGTAYFTEHFSTLLGSSTAVVANFESAVANPHIQTESGGMRFSTTIELLSVLSQLSVTHASLANNHALDYGTDGYQGARRALTSVGIEPFGHSVLLSTSSLVYIPYGSTTVAVLGIHTLFAPVDATIVKALIAEAKNRAQFVVAYVHWGDEYVLVHNKAQETLAQTLAEAGVDLVIGHHPHVVQDIDMVDGTPVIYSLGNFIFDQYFSADVKTGLLVGLTLEADTFTLTLHPHEQCAPSVPCPLEGTAETVFLTALAERSGVTKEQIMARKLVFER